jgi:hypothetical protein
VIFHSTNVFVNLIKVMQRVQDERRKGENDYSTNENLDLSIWVMPLYMIRGLPLVTPLITWTRLIHHARTRPNPITNIFHSPMKD